MLFNNQSKYEIVLEIQKEIQLILIF